MLLPTITLAVLSLTAVQATNYCSTSICPSGVKHIACNNNGAFASSCPAGAYMVDMTPHKSLILAEHNKRRNTIASGSMSGYNAAKRMSTMQWDNELASLAALNVKQCAMRHDACHNTDNFKYSGQNLAYYGYSGAVSGRTDAWLITDRISAWWNEYSSANMNYINKYPNGYSGPAIGHFTIMATDRNTRVGCAASRYFDGKFNNFLMACNYATTNMIGWSVYESGSAGSGCSAGRNPSYLNLCATNEFYANLK